MIETLNLAVIGIVLVQFGLIWYKLGRIEQRCKDVCSKYRGGNNDTTQS